MGDSTYMGFECDFSDDGIFTFVLSWSSGKTQSRKRKSDGVPQDEVQVPLYLGLRPSPDGEEIPVEGEHFVMCCRTDVTGMDPFFISLNDFKARIPGYLDNFEKTYDEDYDRYLKSKNSTEYEPLQLLSCRAWNEDGQLLGSWEALWFPPKFLLPERCMDSVSRRRHQASIWHHIVKSAPSSGAGRLWHPTSRYWGKKKPLKIYLVPLSSWPSRDLLEKICNNTRVEENKKKTRPGQIPLTSWLDWEVPNADFDQSSHVLLSTDLLQYYGTFISREELKRLVDAQTHAKKGSDSGWQRSLPDKTAAESLDKAMSNGQKPVFMETSSTSIKIRRGQTEPHIDAKKIMGGQSANKTGQSWWGVRSSVGVAEWLHRSAYSLGSLSGDANYQSRDNIVFGTFEANSHMTRAETTIRDLRDKYEGTGTLITTIVNANLPEKPSQFHVTYIDPADGVLKDWEIEDWISEKKYTWLAPGLRYNGFIQAPLSSGQYAGPSAYRARWSTQFHTFSRYTPLTLEGKLDSLLLSMHLEILDNPSRETVQARGLVASSSKKVVGPSTLRTQHASSSKHVSFLSSASFTASYRMNPGSRHPRAAIDTSQRPAVETFTRRPDTVVFHAHAREAWNSVVKGAASITLDHVRMEKPRLAAENQNITLGHGAPPATGFMLEGTISLFGLDTFKVSLQSWHGPQSSLSSGALIYQRVQLPSVSPAVFIPLLENTPLGNLDFRNVTITFQNHRFIKTMLPGWTIAFDMDIDETFGSLHTLLTDLSVPRVKAHASAYLGLGHSWASHPKVTSFEVTGILEFADPSEDQQGLKLCPGVSLSQLGVSMFGVSVPSLGLQSRRHTDYGFGLFGDMHITVPGSITPLDLAFDLNELGGVFNLHATLKGDIWKNAFGTGIDLNDVELQATVAKGAWKQSLEFSIDACLSLNSVKAVLRGTFTPSLGHYNLSTYIEGAGPEGIASLFHHYSGTSLQLESHVDISIGSITLNISNLHGLMVEVDHFSFDVYEAKHATVHLSSAGVLVRAELENIALPGELGVRLSSAYMQASFSKVDTGRSTDIELGGRVQLDGDESLAAIEATVHLYTIAGSSDQIQWTIYGRFTDLGNSTTLGTLFPVLNQSFMQDFALQDLMFIAASVDDPAVSPLNPHKYPINKGVQLVAQLDQIKPLNKLLRRASFPGIILKISWAGGADFKLHAILPTETFIHLGHGITTDPIALSIDIQQFLLQIATGVQIPVPNDNRRLDFEAALTIKGESVKLEGEMNGTWNNPFGVGEHISVGPFIELGLAIDLLLFPETGLPTSFSFAGGIDIGHIEGRVAVQISEIPTRELLCGEIKNVGIQDLVNFAAAITQLNIPIPPAFITFEDLKLYISSGVTLGTVTYPPGFSFTSSLNVFDVHVIASAEVSEGALKIHGSIRELHVGPLHISGEHGADATLDISIGACAQHLAVDGIIAILDSHVGLTLHLELIPQPTFSFVFQLNFAHMFVIVVNADMVGNVADLDNLSSLNFSLHAVFEQHVVEYVKSQVVDALERLKKRSDEAIAADTQALEQEKKKYQASVDDAENKLKEAYDAWTLHAKQIHNHSQQLIDHYTTQLREKQDGLKHQRESYDKDIQAAEGKLQHAKADAVAKIRHAEADVTRAKAKWDADVAEAEKRLSDADEHMQAAYGSAEHDIEDAKRKVDGLQLDIDNTQSRIQYCEDSAWYRFDLKGELPWLFPKLAALEAAKVIADGVLTLAEDVVKGVAYLEAKAAVPLAKEAVVEAGKAGDLAFRGAQATLRQVESATAAAIDTAKGALDDVRKAGDKLLRAAEYALQKFIDTSKAVLVAAQRVIDDLIHSAEYLAYHVADDALKAAKLATHGIDVAQAALDVAQKVVDGAITVAEVTVEAALSTSLLYYPYGPNINLPYILPETPIENLPSGCNGRLDPLP